MSLSDNLKKAGIGAVTASAIGSGAYYFNYSEQAILSKVHPDLQKVVLEARDTCRTKFDYIGLNFRVLEGRRSLETQRKNVAKGASKTMNSRHLTGHAVDIFIKRNGTWTWDTKYYNLVAKECFYPASKKLGIPITWGGEWRFYDGGHYQLHWRYYPK